RSSLSTLFPYTTLFRSRYGIPDFKIEKHHIERRIVQMSGEGVHFHCGVHVGVDLFVAELLAGYDAVLFCGGSETPRSVAISGARSEEHTSELQSRENLV